MPDSDSYAHRPALRRLLTAAAWILGVGLVAILIRQAWWLEDPGTRELAAASDSQRSDVQVFVVSSEASPLRLQLERDKKQLVLRWNPSSPSVKSAVCGSVAITDSGAIHNVALAGPQLQSGHYAYNAMGTDVEFRFEVWTRQNELLQNTLHFVDSEVTDLSLGPPAPLFSLPQDDLASASAPESCALRASSTSGVKLKKTSYAHSIGGPALGVPYGQQISGEKVLISLNAVLDELGNVRDVRGSTESNDAGLVTSLSQQLRQWRFSPHDENGEFLPASVQFEITLQPQ